MRLDVFWEEFKGCKIEVFEASVKKILGSQGLKWFPAPVEVWDFVRSEYGMLLTKTEPLLLVGERTITREQARQLLKEVFDKIGKEEEVVKKKRVGIFEKRRNELKKQAQMIRAGER